MKALKYMMMGMLVSLTASCGNDWLDVESSTKIPTETAIQNLDDVEYSLNGIYDVMRSTNYYSGRMIYYGDVTGDDAQSIKTGKRTTATICWTIQRIPVRLPTGLMPIRLSRIVISFCLK